ncbi:MAG TPA: DNA repair protein RecO [Pyrinomonadaceae bacterium]|nr:DNA repair protein RecO [Pyrinomonadaceae bacterium]
MGLVETEAIVLRTYKLSEADKIAVCLTRQAGLVRGVARGARRLKSRFGAGLEPFTHVNLTYFEKEGRELVTLSRAEIVRSHFAWASSAEALPVLGYLCELTIEFAPPHDTDERLFRMVRACMEAAAENPSALASVAVYYELWVLRLAGFLPELRRCGGCGRGLPAEGRKVYATPEGVLRCEGCAGSGDYAFDPEAHAQMREMQAKGPAVWAESFGRMSAGGRQRLSELTRRLLRRALEKDLRSQGAAAAASGPAEARPGAGPGAL